MTAFKERVFQETKKKVSTRKEQEAAINVIM